MARRPSFSTLRFASALVRSSMMSPASTPHQSPGSPAIFPSQSTGQSIAGKLSVDEYDGVLVSVATFQALEKAPHVIKDVKRSFPRTMVVLGGVATQLREARLVTTGADLVTNNIDDALDSLSGSDLSLRVAE